MVSSGASGTARDTRRRPATGPTSRRRRTTPAAPPPNHPRPDWLARHPRFHLHFTPTGSSWINQVEPWFGLLTEQLIRRGVHQSVVALENDVRQWINNWNEDPKPFVWTKTAEDILQSLAKYIAKISGAGH